MKKITIAVLLSAFVAAPAFAADQGFYIGANVGQASTSMDNTTLTKKSDTALTVLAGYQVMKYFAVEAQYNHLGNIGDPGGNNHSVTGYSLVAVGIYPFNEEWSGFAKLGYASTSIAITPTDSKKSAATYGIGGQYNINQALGVRVGYDMYSIGGDAPVFNNNAKTGVVSVGVVYKF